MSCMFGNRNCYSKVVTLSKSEYVTFDDIDFDIFGLSDEDVYEGIHYIYHNYEPFSVILSRKIVNKAKNELDKLDLKSELDRLNKFHLVDLQIGRLLGSGGQSNVFEIIAINKITKRDYNDNGFRELDTGHSLDQEQDCYNHRNGPLAIKMLRHTLMETPLKFANAAVDLMLEAAFLSSLDHPSIVKLQGISAGGTDGYHGGRHDSFFLILDLLPETLRDRLIRWRKYDKKLRKGIWTLRANNKDVEKNLFMIERLKVATEIASGMAYLHSRRLVYRDLKPCNIGFDIQDQVKIFDFGLCAALPAKGICDVYTMIGGVGTYGYMSPEVAAHKPYNQGCDVFSFAVVLYEILSLKQLTLKCREKVVDTSKLKISKQWPDSVKLTLQKSLSHDISERPSMEDILNVLRHSISLLQDS